MKIFKFVSAFVPAFCCLSVGAAAGQVEIVSASDPSTPRSITANGNSLAPVFSGDGRFLVFTSEASNLVTNDHNGAKLDVFVQALATGTITLVSVSSNGESGNGNSYAPIISSNGQFVAFLSDAANLTPNDTNNVTDVFARDLVAGTTTLVSVGLDGASADGESFSPVMSSDGGILAFASRASNLVADDKNGRIDIFLRDLREAKTSSVTAGSLTASSRDAEEYALSDDGHWIVFTTPDTNIVATVQPGTPTTVYARDLIAGNTVRLAIDPSVTFSRPGPLATRSVALSGDGRYAVIEVEALPPTGRPGLYLTDLKAGTNLWLDGQSGPYNLGPFPPAFSADSQTMAFTLAASASDQRPVLHVWNSASGVTVLKDAMGKAFPARRVTLNPDGKRIAFLSDAADLLSVAAPTNQLQLCVLDLPSNILRIVNVTTNGEPAGGVEYASPQFSPDGRLLAFQSSSAALVPNDRNNSEDVFLYDWEANQLSLVSAALPSNTPTAASHGSSFIAHGLSVDGRYVLFTSMSDDLVPADRNGLAELFVRDRVTGRTQLVNVTSDGNGLNELIIREAVLSGNGRFVAFVAENHKLLRTQTEGTSKVYVRDLGLGQTLLASVNTNGLPGAGQLSQVSISADGRYVVFVSLDARDLVPGLAGPVATVVRDLKLSKTIAIEADELRVGIPGSPPSLSGLGGKVFSMLAAPFILRGFIVDADTGTRWEIPVPPRGIPAMSYDGRRAVVFVSGGTTPAVRWSDQPFGDWHEIPLPGDVISSASLSADGHFAAVGSQQTSSPESEAALLVDLGSGAISRLDGRPNGGAPASGISSSASLDANARSAAFRSDATDLVANIANLFPDIFLRDIIANQTTLVSSGSGGVPANDLSFLPLVSANGRVIVFSSWADNMAPGDFNHAGDIFAFELPERPFTDSDGDGLDDLWELANFGNLLRDGKGDFDGDGASDAAEFTAGTSPINDLSVFRLAASIQDSGVTLSWTTEPNRNYQLSFRESLETAWQPLGDVIHGDGNSVRQTVSPNQTGQRFYEVTIVR